MILILGAVLVPLLRGWARNIYMVALPIIGLASVLALPDGNHFELQMFNYNLVPVRVDSLSTVFGIIFHVAAILSVVYAFHIRDAVQQTAGLIYAGAAIGGTFAGDLITLFIYWELTAIASVFLIWASRTERS
ncbi:uncharacterized protein METZ01_LOCUS412279, partial [marine metagenome]